MDLKKGFFESYYNKLPKKIKYSSFVYYNSLKLSKFIRNRNKSNKELDSQNYLLNMIFINSDIKFHGTLRNIQLLSLELLRFIDNVCRKYDLGYWLDFGTLLGAVRHGGFIPWDDDVDISMIRKDYDKLIEVLPKEIEKYDYLKENFCLTKRMKDNENYFKNSNDVFDIENIDELRINNSHFLNIGWMKPTIVIDVFPRDYLLDDKFDYYKKMYEVRRYEFCSGLSLGEIDFEDNFIKLNEELGLVSYETSFVTLGVDTSNFLVDETTQMTENIFPLNELKFENYNLKVPNNYDAFLKRLFGDYMKIPSSIVFPDNIIRFIENQFDSKEEMDKSFEHAINSLKEINDNFEY